MLSGVGAVPSDDDLESVTLSAYRELNKSSGQSISKTDFTKWVLRFAAGGGGGDAAMSRASDVLIESALEHFRVVTPTKESSPAHEEAPDDKTGGDDASAGDEENNTPVEMQEAKSQLVEVDLMCDESSAFDAAYQAQDEEVAQVDGEEDYAEAASATAAKASPEKDETDEASYAEEAAAPEHEESFEVLPEPAVSAEHEETTGGQSDDTQEYEQEFAPETPRNADSAVAVVEETYDEEQDAEHVEADAEVDRSPSPPPPSEEPVVSSEPQHHESELSASQQESEKAVNITSLAEPSALFDEQVSAADAEHKDEEVSRPPVPSDEASELKAVAEAKFSVLEADADYEVSCIHIFFHLISL